MAGSSRERVLVDLAQQALVAASESQWWGEVATSAISVLFAADACTLNVVNPVERFGWFQQVFPVAARTRMKVGMPMDQVLLGDHPFSHAARAPGLLHEPTKVTDLVSPLQWRGMEAYERMRYLAGGTHHMVTYVPRVQPYIETISLVRADRDFDAQEMQLAKGLQSVVGLAVPFLRRSAERLRSHGEAFESESAAVAASLRITIRERDVLGLRSDGLTTAQLCKALGVSARTVYKHEQNLYRKLGVADGRTALARARHIGLLMSETSIERGPQGPELTPRERSVLQLLAEGMSNSSIGDSMMISPKTVDIHVGNILRKLDARTRTQAVTTAFRCGLVS